MCWILCPPWIQSAIWHCFEQYFGILQTAHIWHYWKVLSQIFYYLTFAMFEALLLLPAAPAWPLHDLLDAGDLHPELSPDPVPHELVIDTNLVGICLNVVSSVFPQSQFSLTNDFCVLMVNIFVTTMQPLLTQRSFIIYIGPS